MKVVVSASVLTVACPHILLGKITPVFKKKGDRIQGIFSLSIDEYPILKNKWGSVRIEVPPGSTDGYFAPIIVSKVPKEEFGVDYTCIYTQCPHWGKIVGDLRQYIPDTEVYMFVCDKGHGSVFHPDGKYFDGPANGKNLITYPVEFDGKNTLIINIPAIIYSDVSDVQTRNLAYMSQNEPNPCDKFTNIKYRVRISGSVKISVITLTGKEIEIPVNTFHQPGSYNLVLSTYEMLPGIYFYKMISNGEEPIIKKMIVQH